MTIGYHKNFFKALRNLPAGTENKFAERLRLFQQNKNHPLLDNHSVHRAYPYWRSINITGDIRALYEEKDANYIVFMKIGTHSQLYG